MEAEDAESTGLSADSGSGAKRVHFTQDDLDNAVADALDAQRREHEDRMAPPREGWQPVHAGDVFLADLSGISESRSLGTSGNLRNKYVIAIRDAIAGKDAVGCVIADSYKDDNPRHRAIVGEDGHTPSGGHVALLGAEDLPEDAPKPPMNKRSLVDCTEVWPIHRSRLGKRRRSFKKRYKGRVSPEELSQIHDAIDHVNRDQADLSALDPSKFSQAEASD